MFLLVIHCSCWPWERKERFGKGNDGEAKGNLGHKSKLTLLSNASLLVMMPAAVGVLGCCSSRAGVMERHPGLRYATEYSNSCSHKLFSIFKESSDDINWPLA